ncbi:hypothetical protein [Maledivibacter halophilus]|uniref:Uncharacterized protein n=1 Tax=Maledivibacter halophilus TaxID=36842 RepID=A0A1T5KE79_9FIRM|nr:hypothetical protein [Maledivibacter halophilus]SKC61994.1 hypothetical protein SAMN02194393_01729 [Maledivibacter halophilus]
MNAQLPGQIGIEFYFNQHLKIRPKPNWIGKLPKNYYWCPYCGEIKKFKVFKGYKRCELCHISMKDYYVKKFNKLELI